MAANDESHPTTIAPKTAPLVGGVVAVPNMVNSDRKNHDNPKFAVLMTSTTHLSFCEEPHTTEVADSIGTNSGVTVSSFSCSTISAIQNQADPKASPNAYPAQSTTGAIMVEAANNTGYSDRDSEDEDEESLIPVHIPTINNSSIGHQLNADDEQDPMIPLAVVTRHVLKIGRAALKYGSFGISVETFMKAVIEMHGYTATCGVMNGDMFVSAYYDDGDVEGDLDVANDDLLSDHRSLPLTIFVPYQEGFDLSKLGVLADLCHKVLTRDVSLEQAVKQLKVIDQLPAPFGAWSQLVCFIATGSMVAIVFRGSWNDVWLAGLGSIWTFCCMNVWSSYLSSGAKVFVPVACSFVPAILATTVYYFLRNNVNVTISVLSSVIIPVPGYTISKGLDELVNDRIMLGASHCIQGIVTLLWLALGGYGGKTLVTLIVSWVAPNNADFGANNMDNFHEQVDFIWMALAVPILCACLAVGLQIAYRDFFPAVFVMGMAFVTLYITSILFDMASANVGIMLAAAVTAVLANGYGRILNRPKTIVLVPAILLLVSGSIGFRGIASLLDGESFVGAQQFAQMIVVALMIIVGVFVGNLILPPRTTI